METSVHPAEALRDLRLTVHQMVMTQLQIDGIDDLASITSRDLAMMSRLDEDMARLEVTALTHLAILERDNVLQLLEGWLAQVSVESLRALCHPPKGETNKAVH